MVAALVGGYLPRAIDAGVSISLREGTVTQSLFVCVFIIYLSSGFKLGFACCLLNSDVPFLLCLCFMMAHKSKSSSFLVVCCVKLLGVID